MAQYCFFISALLYSEFSEILVILRNFFEGTRKEDDEMSEELNVSSSSLFAKLGMFHPGFVYSLEFLKKYMEILIFYTWRKQKIIWKKWEEVWSCFQAATSAWLRSKLGLCKIINGGLSPKPKYFSIAIRDIFIFL